MVLEMKWNPYLVGVVLLSIGLIIIVVGVYSAYEAYHIYKPVFPMAKSLDEAITNTAYELVNLVLKLGFLGLVLWGGGIVAKYGVSMIVELYKADKGELKRMEQSKSESQ